MSLDRSCSGQFSTRRVSCGRCAARSKAHVGSTTLSSWRKASSGHASSSNASRVSASFSPSSSTDLHLLKPVTRLTSKTGKLKLQIKSHQLMVTKTSRLNTIQTVTSTRKILQKALSYKESNNYVTMEPL